MRFRGGSIDRTNESIKAVPSMIPGGRSSTKPYQTRILKSPTSVSIGIIPWNVSFLPEAPAKPGSG